MKGRKHNKGYASGGTAKAAVMKSAHEGTSSIAKPALKVSGGISRLRLDRPGRKRGGRVGADKAPLSTAATTTTTAEK